jgi:hypothetical protein
LFDPDGLDEQAVVRYLRLCLEETIPEAASSSRRTTRGSGSMVTAGKPTSSRELRSG